MQYVILGRQMGKTHAALEWLRRGNKKQPRVLVTHDEREADRLRDLLRDPKTRELPLYQSVVAAHMARHRNLNSRALIAVDNVDLVLFHIFGAPVVGVTGTGVATDTLT